MDGFHRLHTKSLVQEKISSYFLENGAFKRQGKGQKDICIGDLSISDKKGFLVQLVFS
jgi:hypothetical protein